MRTVISYQDTNKKGQRVGCLGFIPSRRLLATGPLACGIVFILHLSVREALREVKANDQPHICI